MRKKEDTFARPDKADTKDPCQFIHASLTLEPSHGVDSTARRNWRKAELQGGRPSDPKWNVRRVIPLKEASWNYLRQQSGKLRVSPGHLAAMLLEREIAYLKSAGKA